MLEDINFQQFPEENSNSLLDNPKKFKYAVNTVMAGILLVILINIGCYFYQKSILTKAIGIVQVTDFGYHNLNDQLASKLKELEPYQAYELDSESNLTNDPAYRRSMQGVIDKPIIEPDQPKWEAHVRSGDGDKTPASYVWVVGTQKINIYRITQFNHQKKKIQEQILTYGPFLIDLEHNLYSGSTSDGSGWVDFWNMEKVDQVWKPIPNKIK